MSQNKRTDLEKGKRWADLLLYWGHVGLQGQGRKISGWFPNQEHHYSNVQLSPSRTCAKEVSKGTGKYREQLCGAIPSSSLQPLCLSGLLYARRDHWDQLMGLLMWLLALPSINCPGIVFNNSLHFLICKSPVMEMYYSMLYIFSIFSYFASTSSSWLLVASMVAQLKDTVVNICSLWRWVG